MLHPLILGAWPPHLQTLWPIVHVLHGARRWLGDLVELPQCRTRVLRALALEPDGTSLLLTRFVAPTPLPPHLHQLATSISMPPYATVSPTEAVMLKVHGCSGPLPAQKSTRCAYTHLSPGMRHVPVSQPRASVPARWPWSGLTLGTCVMCCMCTNATCTRALAFGLLHPVNSLQA